MVETKLTRRGFIKASAATAALASAGTVGFNEWSKNYVKAGANAVVNEIPSTCNACSSKCGMIGHVKNGRLWKLTGHPDHPYSKGKLCARGHGYATVVYSKDRLTQPLKRIGDNKFEPISWEQAYKEIAQKLNQIIKEHGPQSVALTEDPRASGKFYSPRFINSLGSSNYYTHHVVCSNSRDAGFLHTVGVSSTSADISNAKYIMFIGRSYGDGIRPSSVQSLAAAKDNGAKIVIVDPRLNNTGNLATEWLAIRPGTDLALVLAMSHVLIKENLHDAEFIKNYSIGYEEYAKELKKYTPEWAEGITSIPADAITRIAIDMGKAKPKALIEQSWRGAFGCNYENSTETGRAVAMFNALLGNYQQKGGSIFGGKPSLGKLDESKHPNPKEPESPKAGKNEFPLAYHSHGVATIVAKEALEGKMRAAIYYHSNAALGYGNPKVMKEALSKMDLVVAIDVQMSETAQLAHYVLPEVTYIERDEVIEGLSGKIPGIALRQQMVEKVHPKTKPINEIYTELAKACGVGQYFNFTLDELNEAMLAPTGVTYKQLREKGTIMFPNEEITIGEMPKLKTPSGKVEFYSETYKEAGFKPIVEWIEPKVSPKNDSFRLITGKQAIHSHTQTANIPILMQITKDYDLERIWINPVRAKALGIKDGDLVELKSSEATSKIRVKVTERIHPEAIFVPSHYGITSKDLKTGYGVGFGYMEHVPFDFEKWSGAGNIHEVIVKVRKVNS
ncbi:molybdopterin-containing oxidoreductase family protein [Mesobacillus selenatarsenatis]|uniref:Molybdopterin-dependent oxidoreductase n=1 Tax=Mesobacillus selenatarsenatis TaxID=388741 RepID=A0A846TI56_9BACI|nr:molybdopterin-dependent oxidoreductase [Mesobacillus selenatarsenatis]NKE06469.1 molybdopterin-dependent oxidoreductase [Mesobacillus selenatarsenatis]